MRAITICVDYDDLLSITLATNRRFFSEYLIVTSMEDVRTVAVAEAYDCKIYKTNSFYLDGAAFNKGRAMEEGFDILGREDWICILDADILLPPYVDLSELDANYLYSPHRHMIEDLREIRKGPWSFDQFPLKEEYEFAGYCQIFHGESRYVKGKQWYSTNWKHAGGCDSDFQALFPRRWRTRPNWTVAHLGTDFRNWCGRVSERIDGKSIPNLTQHLEDHQSILGERKPGYEGEKL